MILTVWVLERALLAFMNNILKTIILSILKTSLVSAVLMATLYMFFSVDLIVGFTCTYLLQLICFYIWNTYVQYRLTVVQAEQETQRIVAYSAQGIDVKCAHCSTSQFVPIRMDTDNTFECDSCGEGNSIYIDVVVARSGDKVGKNAMSVGSYSEDKITAINEIRKK